MIGSVRVQRYFQRFVWVSEGPKIYSDIGLCSEMCGSVRVQRYGESYVQRDVHRYVQRYVWVSEGSETCLENTMVTLFF